MGYIVFLSRLGPFCFLANTNFYINWTSKVLPMNVHEEGYSRNATYVVRSTQ